jgi:tRNA A-37 threonylcarbamoyl transferase component Bud32
MPAAIRACKNESGDALNKAAAYYGHFLGRVMDSPGLYRNQNTRFPCILMVDQGESIHLSSVHIQIITVYAGPIFGFYGAIWDGQIRVEALVTFDLTTRHLNEKGRFAIASGLDAFKEAVDDIQAHYAGMQAEAAPPPHNSDVATSRKFPYLTSFEINGQQLACVYRSRLATEVNLIFSVTSAQVPGKYVVKFTRQYSVEAHEWLASCNLAPQLRQRKNILGGWIIIFMDYSRYTLLSDLNLLKEQQEKVQLKVTMVLKKFHDQGFVHGDVRKNNILVDRDSLSSRDADDVRIHFVDFDWAGKVGEAKYPFNINTKTVKRPDGVEGGVLITREHDEIMARYMFPEDENA